MEGSKSDKSIDEAFREILEEDGLLEPESQSANCPENCNPNKDYRENHKRCECIRLAENSSRFSLRLMEAIRSLERIEPTCRSIGLEEIVSYIRANYRDDGDLRSQVRTSLGQLCSQGFVAEFLEGEYHLIGPIANSLNRISTNRRPGCPKACKKDSFEEVEESSPCSTCPSNQNDCECGAPSFDDRTGSRPALRANNRVNRSRGGSRREKSVRDDNESESGNDRASRSVDRKSPNVNLTGREEMDDLSSETDEIYRELNVRTPKRSNTRDKELKEWIKRCKRDCERKRSNK